MNHRCSHAAVVVRGEPCLLLRQRLGRIQSLEEFSKGFGRVPLLFPDAPRILPFQTEGSQRLPSVGGPKGGEDVSARGGFHDSSAAIVALFRTAFGFDSQACGVFVRVGHRKAQDLSGQQTLLGRSVVVLQGVLQRFGGGAVQPRLPHKAALIDAFHHGLLHRRRDDAFVHGQALPGVNDFANPLNARFGKGPVGRPSSGRPDGVQRQNGREDGWEHGQGEVMDERSVLFRERLQGVQAQADHGSCVEPERNVTVWRVTTLHQLLGVQPFGGPHLLTVNFSHAQIKSRPAEHVLQPVGRWFGFGARAHKTTFPTEKVHAASCVLFPGKHAQREVGVVLYASEVPGFSVAPANVRARTEGARVELTDHVELLVVGSVERAGERLRDVVTSLGHHAFRKPFQVVLLLDDFFNFRQRFGDGVGSSPAQFSSKLHGRKMAAWIFQEVSKFALQFFGGCFVGLFGASHPGPCLFLTGELHFGRRCHGAPQPSLSRGLV